VEWAKVREQPQDWKNWWENPEARAYYFIGKDNIFFHTSLWPAQLMGAGKQFLKIFSGEEGLLTLPYDVPANQFMNLEGQKISGSRNWAVWGRDALTRYDPDALRYYLTINMPEMHDSDWDWGEFVAKNNGELVATWGNLANRVLSFCYKHWDGFVPEIDLATLRPADLTLLDGIGAGFRNVGELLESVKLRAALQECFRLATTVNQYLDQNAPWQSVKIDKDATALTIFTALRAIDSLKIMFAPFLPFTCETLNGFFGYDTRLFGTLFTENVVDDLGEHEVLRHQGTGQITWKPSELAPGAKLNQPGPLFKKLEEKIVEEERARLGK
jgi:methionyl-tRNA synthetase